MSDKIYQDYSEFWELDDINPCVHQWCFDLSRDRYDVWLLNKKYKMTFFYSVNHKSDKEPWLMPLDKLNDYLLTRKKADLIYKNENFIVYVRYVNILTREDKAKLKQSLIDYWRKYFGRIGERKR